MKDVNSLKCSNCKHYYINKEQDIESNECSLIQWFYFKPFEEKNCIFVNNDYSINEEMIKRFA